MPAPHALAGLTGKFASLGIAAKVGVGASLAAAGIVGASAAGALPAPADHAVRHAVAAVTPLETDAPRDEEPENFGQQVADDATGESDGEKGVDGPSIAASSPGAEHRSDSAAPEDPPGQSGDTGLTRASETPAAAHAPDSAPGGPADDGTDGIDDPGPAGPPDSTRGPGAADQHQPNG